MPYPLAQLFSAIDSAKRRASDAAKNPLGAIQMLGDQLGNYNAERVPVIYPSGAGNRPMTKDELDQKYLDLALSIGPGVIKPKGGQWLKTQPRGFAKGGLVESSSDILKLHGY